MNYSDDRFHLKVAFRKRQCPVPADELSRMQRSLVELGEAVRDFPQAALTVTLVHHPRSQTHHVEFRLQLPGRTLATGDADPYLDSAFQRCLRKLLHRVESYRENPDRASLAAAARTETLGRAILAPEDPGDGLLGRAVEAGDYRAFRNTLANYEDWLRRRIGRWIQRYPEAEARLGRDLAIGDVVEEVYLNAFEQLAKRPSDVPFHEWLEGLIDPSLKALMDHPEQEQENASLARTLRETPL
jgi:hypothetical protein